MSIDKLLERVERKEIEGKRVFRSIHYIGAAGCPFLIWRYKKICHKEDSAAAKQQQHHRLAAKKSLDFGFCQLLFVHNDSLTNKTHIGVLNGVVPLTTNLIRLLQVLCSC